MLRQAQTGHPAGYEPEPTLACSRAYNVESFLLLGSEEPREEKAPARGSGVGAESVMAPPTMTWAAMVVYSMQIYTKYPYRPLHRRPESFRL